MSSVSLRAISTYRDARVTMTQFIPDNQGNIDKLEYGMGLRRGGILDYKMSPSLLVDVYEDMEPLLRRWKWTLLPSLEILQSVIDLFLFNFNQLPNERRHFTQDLPEQEYEYQLLPPVENTDFLPIYVNGTPVKNSRHPLYIKSRVHPCFVLRSLLRYKLLGATEKLSPNPITDAIDDLLSAYCCITRQPVYLSWLGPPNTWSQFRRSFLVALEDPPPGSAPRYVLPATSSSRKGKRTNGRKASSERSRSSVQKSVHLRSRTTQGKRRGTSSSVEEETVSTPGEIGMTTRRTARSR